MTRPAYIMRLAILLSLGTDDPSATDQEWQEADILLQSIGVTNQQATTIISEVKEEEESASVRIEIEPAVRAICAGAHDSINDELPEWLRL